MGVLRTFKLDGFTPWVTLIYDSETTTPGSHPSIMASSRRNSG